MAQTLRLSWMFAPNRNDRLIERPETRYTWIPFQEYEINRFQRMVLYFPSFVETISRCYAPVHD